MGPQWRPGARAAMMSYAPVQRAIAERRRRGQLGIVREVLAGPFVGGKLCRQVIVEARVVGDDDGHCRS